MADFKWDDYEETKDSFDWEAHPTIESVSELDSAGRGFVQGASLGFRDEAAGAVASPIGAIKEIANKFGADITDADVEAYKKERDASRALDEAARAANPKSYAAGEFGGAVATSFVPGLNVAKGAGLASAAGKAALQGGLMAAGSSEGESIGDMARDTATGVGLGAAGGAIGYGIGKGVEKLGKLHAVKNLSSKAADKLDELAETSAARAQGAGAREFRDRAAVRALGREGLDSGIVTVGASTDDMLARAERLRDTGGDIMGQVYNQIDDAGASTFKPLDVAVKVEQELNPTYRTPINRSEWGQLDNTIESILQRGDASIPMSEAQALKKEIQAVAFPKGRRPIDPSPKQQMAMDAYSIISKEIDDAAEAGSNLLGIDGLKEMLQEGKRKFAAGKRATDLLAAKLAREEAGTGLASRISGAFDEAQVVAAPFTGGLTGKTLALKKGLDLIKVNKDQIAAVTADKLADIARSTPNALGKYAQVIQRAAQRGGQAVAATHFVLQQSDPEYRAKIKELEDSQN